MGCGDGTAGATRQSKRNCPTALAISCANASVKRCSAERCGARCDPRRVGPSRLPEHRLVSHDAEARLRASVGQSLEDWLRVRFGRIAAVVDGVAFPETEDEVRDVLAWARDIRAIAIPVGGATSVVGHLTPKAERGRRLPSS